MRIAVDIDNTLYDFHPLLEAALGTIGIHIPKHEFTTYDHWSPLLRPGQMEALYAHFHSDEAILNAQPYEGSVGIIRQWQELGHEVYLVSTRKEDRREVTEAWMSDHGFDVPLVCSPTHDKVSTMREDVRLVVDDHPNTIVEAVAEGRHVATIVHPWTANFIAVNRVVTGETWAQMGEEITRRDWV